MCVIRLHYSIVTITCQRVYILLYAHEMQLTHTLRALGMSSFSSEMIPQRTPLVSLISSSLLANEHFKRGRGKVVTDL